MRSIPVRFLAVAFVLVACSGEQEATGESDTDEAAGSLRLGVTVPTAQLLNSLYGGSCDNGWTELYHELASDEGNEHIVPLQEDYVNRFVGIEDFRRELGYAASSVSDSLPIFLLALPYACWNQNPIWRESMPEIAADLQARGAEVYLVLSHNDSFPADLIDYNDIGNSGWANSGFVDNWLSYVEDVIDAFQGVLPDDTRILLAQEPVVALFNGYLHGEGKYPPGGKRAGIAFTRAYANLERAYVESARLIADETDWMPSIGKNIRPVSDPVLGSATEVLDYVWNWALLNAVVTGCIDTNLDTLCNERVEPLRRFEIGITFYGTMSAGVSDVESVTIGESLGGGRTMTLPWIDVGVDAGWFAEALRRVSQRYPGTPIAVSELGFSAADEGRQLEWFQSYLDRVRSPMEAADSRFEVSYVLLHTLFAAAEFSPGEWRFHIIDECSIDGDCSFTDWGRLLLDSL